MNQVLLSTGLGFVVGAIYMLLLARIYVRRTERSQGDFYWKLQQATITVRRLDDGTLLLRGRLDEIARQFLILTYAPFRNSNPSLLELDIRVNDVPQITFVNDLLAAKRPGASHES